MSFVFDPDRPVAQNLSRVGGAELRMALDLARDVTRAPAERIHEARTHCKKVRAVLRLVGKAFPGYRLENAAVRDAAALLSGPRDGAVMRDTLDHVVGEEDKYPPADIARMRGELGRNAGGEDGEAVLQAFAAAIEPIYRRALMWHSQPIDWDDVAQGAGRTYRKAYRAMRKARRSRAAEDLHAWRKQVKYTWHHLTLLRRFAPDRFKTARKAAKELGSMLGGHHDRDVLREHLGATDSGHSWTRLRKHIHRMNDEAADEALARGAELYAAKPKVWRDYLAGLLAAGGAEKLPEQDETDPAGN